VISDRNTAAQVMNCMVEVSARLNESAAVVKDACTESEFLVYRDLVGALFGGIYDIIRPLAEEHPSLSPPGYFPDLDGSADSQPEAE
jgi:hypothetical protein